MRHRQRRTMYIITILLLMATALLSTLVDKLPFLAAKAQLPDVTLEMRTAGFWIGRHPSPDSLILDAAGINSLNRLIRKNSRAVSNIKEHSSVIAGQTVRAQIIAMHDLVSGMKLHDRAGQPVKASFWQDMTAAENRAAIPANVKVRFAFATAFAHQRLVPSRENLNKVATDTEFDELQNSGYDIGTPIVIYHTSADGNWLMGATSLTTGWFRRQDLAFCDRETWRSYQTPQQFAVVTAAKADLWSDPLATRHAGFARMGSRFPLISSSPGYSTVKLPFRDDKGMLSLRDGYIATADLYSGYLPYTARNALNQSFKLLGQSYGWADMQGDWDCSSLLISIYRCFGIELPRNGANQALSGKVLISFQGAESASKRRQEITGKALGGVTLLQLKGHIGIYLGSVDGVPYFLHDAWAYRKASGDGIHQDVNVMARTVVSGLDLGESSAKGSMLMRLVKVTLIAL